MKFRSALCLLVLLVEFAFSPAWAEHLEVCYAYDCAARSDIEFSDAELKEVQSLFDNVENAEDERDAAAHAVGELYSLAGKQSPIWEDHGGNDDDEDVQGRMDCIDHSTNTTEFLLLMQRRGWLRFHEVAEPLRRGFWAAHWGAHLIEPATGEQFVVDSWFYDPGEPAVIFALDSWRQGATPGAHALAMKQTPW